MSHSVRPVLTLEAHATYRCQHSGACCQSGWGIPLAATPYAEIVAAAARGTLTLGPHAGALHSLALPSGATGTVVIPTHHGVCVFHSPHESRCTLHRDMGEASLPPACRHFPRVCRLDRDAIRISLSHYCPTVAGSLRHVESPTRVVVADPASCPASWPYEGLDTAPAGAPLLHPSMYLDHESYVRFELHVVGALTKGRSVEHVLADLRVQVEHLRRWKPRHGPLGRALDEALVVEAPTSNLSSDQILTPVESDWFGQVIDTVPPIARRPARVPHATEAFERWVAPAWPSLARPVLHYVAAKAFGNWTAYLGQGLRTVVRSLEVALAVLKVECTRACLEDHAPATLDHIVRAARAADLLLVHLANPRTLAERLSAVETGPTSARRRPRPPRRAFDR